MIEQTVQTIRKKLTAEQERLMFCLPGPEQSAHDGADRGIMRVLERHLLEIGEAARRLENNGYGVCQDCGRKIDPARLEILPEATRCIFCKRRAEAIRMKRKS